MHKPPDLQESPFKGKTGISRIVQAFFNSIAGLQDAWNHESAFRQEILMAAVLVPVAFMLPLAAGEKALLITVTLFVLVVELLNSSVEAAIDRISFDHHSLSKRAKDIGSAAVLMSLCLMGAVWFVVLAPLVKARV